MNQSKAKIFLAGERSCDESEWLRNYSTFNFGNHLNEHKYPFEHLFMLNDYTISGNSTHTCYAEASSYMLLLPVVGSVICTINTEKIKINPGQLQVIYIDKEAQPELINPFTHELINFILLGVKAGKAVSHEAGQSFSFDLDKGKNGLFNMPVQTMYGRKNTTVSIGKFTGRQEGIYTLQNAYAHVFVFVIEGVFEVQERLLHARDGLGLWSVPRTVSFEALSNDAILLIIELNV